MEKEFLTYEETAKKYNFPLGTLYALVSQGRIPHLRFGSRLVRFRTIEIDKWIEDHKVNPIDEDANVS